MSEPLLSADVLGVAFIVLGIIMIGIGLYQCFMKPRGDE